MAPTTDGTNAGGSANEFGSLHRNGFAALLATHGLSGAPLDGIDGRVPTRIALETDDHVDDIVCTMSSGARWFIQAKRSVNDSSLRSALRQFGAQAVEEDDLLVLALRSVGGYLRTASEVLDSRHAGRRAGLSKGKRDDFEKFEKRVREECGDNAERVLSQARIVAWAVDDVCDERANTAAGRLERLTTPGSGHMAFRALQHFFQQQGAARTETSSDDWLQALRDSGLEVSAEGLGPWAAERELERAALAHHCESIARCKDRLDLSVISHRVPELVVDDFLSTVEVEFDLKKQRAYSKPLTHIFRRNERMLLRGLPGAGKSEAMRQLAAWLVTQRGAPMPLPLRLRDIASAVSTVDDMSLDLLLQASARRGGLEAPAPLVRALKSAVDSGHCVFLLDGLDETYGKRSIIAAGIANIIQDLSPHVGVLITTRESAMDAADYLNLPVADLKASGNRRAQTALIEAYSAAMAAPENQAMWTQAKRAIVENHADAHREIWRVPLLSTLATVRILEGHETSGSVVELLGGVIEDSVDRWEAKRLKDGVAAPDPGFNSRMFLDGFAALGRALNAGSALTLHDAHSLVTATLLRWELSRPATEAIAKFVVKFWDDIVGVFVDTGTALQPRSRLFAELGDAYALLRLDHGDARLAWLTESLNMPARANAFALASGSDLTIARWLITASKEETGHRRAQAATWLIEFLPSWSHLTPDDTTAVMESLAAAARDQICVAMSSHGQGIAAMFASATGWRDRADGCGWRFAAELASLEVAAPHRERKKLLLDAYEANPDRVALLRALSEISIIDPERRTDKALVEILERALEFPLDEYHDDEALPDRFGTLSIGSSNEPAQFGLDRVARYAASISSQLSASAVERIWNIGIRLPAGQYYEIRAALAESGHQSPYASGADSNWAASLPREGFELDWFVPHLLATPGAAEAVHPTERWRKSALSDLVDAANIREASYWELLEANKGASAVTSLLLHTTITCARIDEQAVHLQAHDTHHTTGDERDDLAHYLYTPRLIPARLLNNSISEEKALELVSIAADRPRWASDLTRDVLVQQRYPSVAEAAAMVTPANWHSERNLALVRLFNAASPMAEATALMSEGNGSRWAAAWYVAADDTETNESLLSQAHGDPDAAVRDAAAASLEVVLAAEYWTCTRCFTQNDTSLYMCERCNHSSSNSMKSHEKIREYVTNLEADPTHGEN
ncbi:hypothetical protein ABS642_12945 [Microbacterium sp. A8/3-1]|uniref:RanBP2-type domain-containing protein n=1 Tax=Microbacterium sp. A8/3-1 TaxID=3160749 RepID=A0AAU7VSM3_9MICO